MWILKFQFDGSKIFFGSLAKKFKISLTGYPVSRYEKGKKIFVNQVGEIIGNEKAKSKAIKYLKKSKYFVNLEVNKNFINLLIKEDKKFAPFYNPNFIYISPIRIDDSGKYSYHLGSWKKENFSKLLEFLEKNYDVRIFNIRQERIKNVSITGIEPDLTEKQRNAYELAVKEGYYEYPKKIKIKNLAKLFGISYSTFQQHLKYAEKKISEFFVKR